MTTEKETNWVEKIGKPAADSLRDMVAALECDYERLEELREERDDYAPEDDESGGTEAERKDAWAAVWATEHPDKADELKELEEAAGECKDADDARQRIEEDALSVQVRGDWHDPGAEDDGPSEFQLLLTTGGPAVRIMGELDGRGEPYRAWLEVQDWGKPWTEYYESGLSDVLLAYSRCFCFGG